MLIEEDLRKYLFEKYQHEKLRANEVDQVILKLKSHAASDLYKSNKAIMRLVSEEFIQKREDYHQKDLIVLLAENNYPPSIAMRYIKKYLSRQRILKSIRHNNSLCSFKT